MLNITNPKAGLFLAASALLGWVAVVAGPVRVQAQEQGQIIVITIRLPDDATLFVDDYQTQATGGTRILQTVPLPTGGQYAYTLKAMSKGKEVTRQINVAHGVDNTFDLRAAFLVAASAKASTKQSIASPTKGVVAVHYSTINWGAALNTVEQALHPQPPDASKFPK